MIINQIVAVIIFTASYITVKKRDKYGENVEINGVKRTADRIKPCQPNRFYLSSSRGVLAYSAAAAAATVAAAAAAASIRLTKSWSTL